MDVNLYITRIAAEVLRVRDDSAAAYERYPDATFFWAFIDLSGSSNYRMAHGPREGYVRSEAFFTLVRTVVAPYSEVRLLKEIGDEALLTAPSFRPLLESVLLADATARNLGLVIGTAEYPFGVRACIGFGAAKRLVRPQDDFVGSPIDQLARLMSVRSDRSSVLLHEDAFRPSEDILREYSDFLSVGSSTMLSPELSKGMVRPVFYRELKIDARALGQFTGKFAPWKEAGV